MAKFLDTLFFSGFSFFAFFLLLSFSGLNIRLCAVIALSAAVSTGVLINLILSKKPWLAFRKRRLLSEKYVKSMIYDDASDAHKKAFMCLVKKYPVSSGSFENGSFSFLHGNNEEKSMLCVIQKLKASPDDVLSVWHAFGKPSGVRSMVVAVPGKSDNDLKIQSMRLACPDVVIIDRQKLIALAKKYVKPEAPASTVKRFRPMQAFKGFLTKRRTGRYCLYSILFTLNYIITGSVINLPIAFLFSFLAAFSFIGRFEKERLI